jgi:p-aminobenzoyl-glutamate transporter AbgT
MKCHSNRSSGCGGQTLIEALIYAMLLSFLISGFIAYAYGIHFRNIRLSDEINNQYQIK